MKVYRFITSLNGCGVIMKRIPFVASSSLLYIFSVSYLITIPIQFHSDKCLLILFPKNISLLFEVTERQFVLTTGHRNS